MHSKRLILLLTGIAALVLLVLTLTSTKSKRDIAVGLYAPDFEIKDEISGRKISSEALKNKVLFVNFWASWCQPCREEMPSLESLFREFSGNGQFQVITILYKDPYQDGVAYMKQHGFTFPVYSDSDNMSARNFGVTGVPETYLIDKKGILKKRVIGPADWNSPEAKGFINTLLNE